MRSLPLGTLALVALLLGLPGGAFAQYSMVTDPPSRWSWGAHVASDFRMEFETKSDAGDEFDAWRSSIEGDVSGPINSSILVGFTARYAHSSFDFNLDNGSPLDFGGTRLPREPWNTINVLDLVPHATILVGERVSVVTTVPIRWAAESGAERNGFAGGISAILRWQVSDDLMLGAGIGVTSQLARDAETFPIVALRWRIDENFELKTEGDAFQGGSTALFYGPSETIRLLVSAGFERTRFRLDAYGSARDTDGIAEITTIPVEFGFRLSFLEAAHLDFRTGVGFHGRVRVETSGGNRLYDQRYDPAWRWSIALHVPFGGGGANAPD
ncbi:MAG: hypothetical protein AAGC67_12965 [Myxococcota bacterium]